MNKKIIICSNISGAGKDTVAQYLMNYGYKQYAFADKIREIAIDLFGMETKDRYLLQRIGESMRGIDENVWINYLFKQIEKQDFVLISDMRRQNEYELAINKGYFPIRVVTKREIAIERLKKRDGFCDESLLDNESEAGTRNIKMIEIYNDTTLRDLYLQIDALMELIK